MKRLFCRAVFAVQLAVSGFFLFVFMLVAGKESYLYLMPEDEALPA